MIAKYYSIRSIIKMKAS